jgi:hypothetical protein
LHRSGEMHHHLRLLALPAAFALASLTGCRVTATRTPEGTSTTTVTSAEVQNAAAADQEVILERARGTIEECRGPTAGKITVHARVIDGKLVLRASPDSSLDPRDRQCIYDSLQQIDAEDNRTMWDQAPQIPPSGFTSLVTIEWD